MTGISQTIEWNAGTGDPNVDGLLSDRKWGDPAITYGFADADHMRQLRNYGSGENTGAIAPTIAMQNVVRFALDTDDGNAANDGFSFEGFTGRTVDGGHAADGHIRIAQTSSSSVGVTAWAYFPSWSDTGGDIWFSNARYDFTSPRAGNYAWLTSIHEIGHALGLEHGHESDPFGALPADMDSHEFSVMTYRSFLGGHTKYLANADWGFPQSFMMLDIAALQHMYGAGFDINSGDTTYRWSPAGGQTFVDGGVAIDGGGNVIFATIWDGGGTDLYDLTAYASDLALDLRPGASSLFAGDQLAELGTGEFASGNIYNALQYQGSARSLIEDATAGSGDDSVTGNAANNRLAGNDGHDTLAGLDGADHLLGGNGNDTLTGGRGGDMLEGGAGNDRLDGHEDDDTGLGGAGRDLLRGHGGNDILRGNGDDDRLTGQRGRDRLYGGNGDDLLRGDKDVDLLSGGSGSDTFLFRRIEDSPTGSRPDRIADFAPGQDLVDVSRLTETGFAFIGPDSFTGTGPEIRTVDKGSRLALIADADGDGRGDFRILLPGLGSLTPDDLIL